jgi:predicted house-cleaning noncanonical NTP pyrophosphatase (MazG superfamily)
METASLKEKVTSLVKTSNNETFESVYQLLKSEEYTDEFKNTLTEEWGDCYKTKPVITYKEMNNTTLLN